MSAWRRFALELFPEHKKWIEDKNLTFSIYQLFFDLLPMAKEAHIKQDNKTLTKIYKYAEWCWEQPASVSDIQNAVAVAFYEHLVDDDSSLRDIPHWIKPEIFNGVKVLFEDRLSPDEYRDLVKKYNIANHTHFS